MPQQCGPRKKDRGNSMGFHFEHKKVVPLDGREHGSYRGSQHGWAGVPAKAPFRFDSNAALDIAMEPPSNGPDHDGAIEGFPGSIGSSPAFLDALNQVR